MVDTSALYILTSPESLRTFNAFYATDGLCYNVPHKDRNEVRLWNIIWTMS